ncbi:hypothetical protein [Archangium violaceum]|nr:hypothetical protein [Archangium violaceum]
MSMRPRPGSGVLRLEVELGPGDMLLLPVGGWHGYSAVEPPPPPRARAG